AADRIVRHRKAAAGPGDPEALHQVRVGLRRLRATVRTFRPILDLPGALRPSAVAKTARQLGQGRDLDVLGGLLDRFADELPPPSMAVAEDLSARLKKRRRRAAEQVRSALEGRRFRSLLDAAEVWTTQPRGAVAASLPVGELLHDL